MDIGFVGLGRMGSAMARNLLNAGHRLTVWNRSATAVEPLVAAGAAPARFAGDAFDADVVFSMLADDASVRETVLASGALSRARRGLVHVNCATISVRLARELVAAHAAAGIEYLAAPVFGRPDAAAKALLHIVVAGPGAAIDRVQPLFDVLGQKTWRVGDEGHHANVVKIAGNFMIAATIEMLGEASALVEAHGVPTSAFVEVMGNSIFASPVVKGYGAIVAERRYEPPAFLLPLGLKDVNLALEAGSDASVPLPIASLARDNFLDAIAHGDARKDWSALAEVARRRAGQVTQS